MSALDVINLLALFPDLKWGCLNDGDTSRSVAAGATETERWDVPDDCMWFVTSLAIDLVTNLSMSADTLAIDGNRVRNEALTSATVANMFGYWNRELSVTEMPKGGMVVPIRDHVTMEWVNAGAGALSGEVFIHGYCSNIAVTLGYKAKQAKLS